MNELFWIAMLPVSMECLQKKSIRLLGIIQKNFPRGTYSKRRMMKKVRW